MHQADMIIFGNAIFDGISEEPYQGFVVINGNRIAEVNRGFPKRDDFGMDTLWIDAGDRLVSAGFIDSHVHMLMAGLFEKYANLLDARSEEETVQIVQKRTEELGETEGWIYGFSWYHYFWEKKDLPTKKSLDSVFPDRPVFLLNWEAHGCWVNSKALELCGITKDTPDPDGGRIERDENGEPTGILHESAMGLVTIQAMEFSKEREKDILRIFSRYANSYGVTAITDVQPFFHGNMGHVDVYNEMTESGELTVRVTVAPDLLGDLDEVLELDRKYRSEKIHVDMVKQFVDGVPSAYTGLLLEDYADDPGNKGRILYDLDAIGKKIGEAHRRGLSVKLHSCGDGSFRKAFEWYRDAIKTYGMNECRHCIEHCELAAPEDVAQLGKYHIIPSIQPDAIATTETFDDDPYRVRLGEERAAKTWPFRDLLTSAGVVSYGTDCPVMGMNPFPQICRAVTRLHDDGLPEGGWNPTQKLTVREGLIGYTYGSAYSMHREGDLGTLETGKLADVVIMSKNILAMPPEEVKDVTVDYTIMDGKIVYQKY